MAILILVRHGESLWNAKGLWTGFADISLSDKGKEQARQAGKALKDIPINIAFTSVLKRSKETLEEILKVLGIEHIPIFSNAALNERDYGDYTGKNKWDLEVEFGKEKFLKIRRGWNEPIPNGETLKDVYERVVPYYKEHILPKLKAQKNVLIAAHGNSLRALIKYLEDDTAEEIAHIEMKVGDVIIYELDNKGEVIRKEIRPAD